MKAASAWRRLMGVAYEALLLFGVAWFFSYAFSALAQFRGEPGAARWVFQWYLLAVLGAYFVWAWSNGRRSLPMRTLSMRLVAAAGGPVTTGRAALRFAAAVVMLVLPLALASAVHPGLAALMIVPFAWSALDAQRRTLWDIAAGTRMIVED